MKNISSLILVFVLLMIWQGAAMGIDAAYILPSPVEILVRLWELREPLFTVHLPATMGVTIVPGQIALQRTFVPAKRSAVWRVRPTTAALDAT